jgi:hypothetical protein
VGDSCKVQNESKLLKSSRSNLPTNSNHGGEVLKKLINFQKINLAVSACTSKNVHNLAERTTSGKQFIN